MSRSLSVLTYLGSKEYVHILKASQGSSMSMLGESLGMLQIDSTSLMRSLLSFSKREDGKKDGVESIFNPWSYDYVEEFIFVVVMRLVIGEGYDFVS